MSRSRGNACAGKQSHPTQRKALDHLYGLIRAGGDRKVLRAYQCPWCRSWHVGHYRGGKR